MRLVVAISFVVDACLSTMLLQLQATIAHSQRQGDATSVQFTWTAPNMAGDVDF